MFYYLLSFPFIIPFAETPKTTSVETMNKLHTYSQNDNLRHFYLQTFPIYRKLIFNITEKGLV